MMNPNPIQPNNGSPINNTPGAPKPEPTGESLIPPEPTIWKKYSSHHEFPLSALASVVLHFFVAMVLTMFGTMIFSWGSGGEPVEMEPVEFAGGGGDGDRGGAPEGNADVKETTEESKDADNQLTFKETEITVISDPTRDIEEAQLSQDIAKGIADKAKRAGDIGMGGPGSGGGLGAGIGTGIGDGMGAGRAGPRQKRTERWIINFKFNSAEELAKQLSNIEAWLLVPTNIPNTYKMFKDLTKNPPTPEDITQEGMRKNNRIWYSSSDRNACAAVAVAFRISPVPKYFAIFIPNQLEQEMLKQELGYKGLSEAQIVDRKLETYFNISKTGSTWNVKVIEQRRRGG